MKFSGSSCASERIAAARTGGLGSPSTSSSRSMTPSPLMLPTAVTASRRSVGSAFMAAMSLRSGGRARRVADPAEGTNRFDRQRAIGSFDERRQQRDGRAILHHAEALDGKGPRIRMGILHERQQRGQGTGILEALQRERDRPPAHARLRAIEHGGRQLVVSVQTDQREHRQPQCPNRRIADRVAVGARRLGHRSRLNDRRGHLADRIRRGSIADQPKRLGRAALHERRGITQRGNQRIARGRIADQARPNAAICRTSGSGSARSFESGATPSAKPTRPMASAARRRIRACPSPSSRTRSGGGGGGGGVTTAGGFCPLARGGGGGAGGGAGAGSRSAR